MIIFNSDMCCWTGTKKVVLLFAFCSSASLLKSCDMTLVDMNNPLSPKLDKPHIILFYKVRTALSTVSTKITAARRTSLYRPYYFRQKSEETVKK